MDIVVLGNCQVRGLAHALELYLPDACTHVIPITSDPVQLGKSLQVATSQHFDMFIAHESVVKIIGKHPSLSGSLPDSAIVVPTIKFSAFHPDTQYAYSNGRVVKNGLGGEWNSRIVLYAFQKRLSREDTRRLFRSEVYEALGYFDAWESSVCALKEAFERTGLDFTKWLRRNQRIGVFMHGVNHPLVLALASVAEQLIERHYARQTRVIRGIERYLTDHLASGVWPVYPEIASVLGVRGDYLWRHRDRFADLDGFINLTFTFWESADWRSGGCRFDPMLSEKAKCALTELVA